MRTRQWSGVEMKKAPASNPQAGANNHEPARLSYCCTTLSFTAAFLSALGLECSENATFLS